MPRRMLLHAALWHARAGAVTGPPADGQGNRVNG